MYNSTGSIKSFIELVCMLNPELKTEKELNVSTVENILNLFESVLASNATNYDDIIEVISSSLELSEQVVEPFIWAYSVAYSEVSMKLCRKCVNCGYSHSIAEMGYCIDEDSFVVKSGKHSKVVELNASSY